MKNLMNTFKSNQSALIILNKLQTKDKCEIYKKLETL